MNDKEVLQRAIDIAFSNGWKPDYVVTYKLTPGKKTSISQSLPVATSFIYNHEFAKSLFGNLPAHSYALGDTFESFGGEVKENDFQVEDVKSLWNWQYHLQQMVISEDPIDYLRKLLPLLNR